MSRLAQTIVLAQLIAFLSLVNFARADDAAAYREFGELDGVTKIVEDFTANVMADDRIKKAFAKTDLKRFKEKLTEQLCQQLGGPCIYSGRPMADVHEGFDIKKADFNALVEDLRKAMNAHHISQRTQNQLLAKLAPMHRDIISK